ncbi:hypothetical protein [Escherichia coli]|uniref:hypothetical protein n=1 Tax=Escherichia coli TaxID=562 RepID=UPI0002A32D16|nr:hypothetical protein [Escherichia coli]ELC54767.1 hypothetical protein WGI_05099 [Escherichia coli KTE44]
MLWSLENANNMVTFLNKYIGKTVVIISAGKVFDYHKELADKIMPEGYHFEPGLTLDNGDEVELVAVNTHIVGDGPEFHVDVVLANGKQAYMYMWEGIQIKNVNPQDHGCWYCNSLDHNLVFSGEFDTNLHLDCLKNRLQTDSDDMEAKIMEREFEEELK